MHGVLDLIVHRADPPTLPGSVGSLPLLGFGLWRVPVASILLEVVWEGRQPRGQRRECRHPTEQETAVSYTLQLRQRITVLQNRYDVIRDDDGGQATLAYAEQKRMALRERITFWTDESRSQTAFTLAARNIIELVGTYDVTDAQGTVLATIRKDAFASLARSTYHVDTARGVLTGRERTWWRPIARRVVSAISEVPWLLPLQFDFTDQQGRVVLAVDRQLRLRDQYLLSVQDDDLDWRVAAACGVAVDALMNR
jgi:uncharacterized protein YxjI